MKLQFHPPPCLPPLSVPFCEAAASTPATVPLKRALSFKNRNATCPNLPRFPVALHCQIKLRHASNPLASMRKLTSPASTLAHTNYSPKTDSAVFLATHRRALECGADTRERNRRRARKPLLPERIYVILYRGRKKHRVGVTHTLVSHWCVAHTSALVYSRVRVFCKENNTCAHYFRPASLSVLSARAPGIPHSAKTRALFPLCRRMERETR